MNLRDLTLPARSAWLGAYARVRLSRGYERVAPWVSLVPVTLTSAYGESLGSAEAIAMAKRCLIYRLLIRLDHEDLARGGRAHEILNGEALRAAHREGRGVLVCSMHLGPFFYVALEVGGLGLPSTTVAADDVRDQMQAGWDVAISKVPGTIRTLPARGARTLISCLRALERGDAVTVFIDGQTGVGGPGAGQHHAEVVRMMGLDMRLRLGPAYLAQKAQSPVVMATAYRTALGHRVIEFSDPLPPPRPGGHAERAEFTQSMMPWFEARARQHPEQWGGWFVPILTWAETGGAPTVTREAYDATLARVTALLSGSVRRARLSADRARVAVFRHGEERVFVHGATRRILAATALGYDLMNAAYKRVPLHRLPRLLKEGSEPLSVEVTRMVLAGLATIEGDPVA
jgi:lauroyl/myristoyl acyltransferase